MTDALVADAGTNASPGSVIAPPALVPPRISLLSSSEVINGDSSRWEGGYSYSPEGCGDGGIGQICPAPGTIKNACANPTIVEFSPYYIYGADKCSTWSYKERDFYARATRKLLASESWFIENEFMTDSLGLGNSPVASPIATAVTAVPLPPHMALAALEDAIGDCSHGGRFMIHVRPGILSVLGQYGEGSLIRREGNVWLTAMDNIVVPGRGYPGTGPLGQAVTATSEWIYATSMVQIRRGPIVLTPEQAAKTSDNPQGIPQQAVDRPTNDIFVLAERVVSSAYDPSCCVLAAETSRG